MPMLAKQAPTFDLPPMLMVQDVAEQLSCTPHHVANLIEAGKLNAFDLAARPGNTRAVLRIPVPALGRFINSLRTA